MAFGKQRLALLAAGLTAMLGVTACGTSGPGGAGGASAWGLSGGDERIVRASLERWNENNPDSAIQPQFFANDAYKQKIRTAIGAGQAPTLITGWGGGNLEEWVDAGKVVDLTDELGDKAKLSEKYLSSVVNTGQVDGKTYAVPIDGTQPIMLYYNKKLFRKVGAQPPETWQDLMALVPKFREAGVAPFAIGGQSKWPLLMWEEYLVDRIGGAKVFNAIADNEKGAWSHPAIIKANRMIQDLVDAGGFVEGFNSIDTDSGADAALLYTDKAAMYLMGTWAYPSIKEAAPEFIANGNLGYTTFPTVGGGAGNPANIVGNPANFWSVSSDASPEAKRAAKKYLKNGLMNKRYIDKLLGAGTVPPVTGIEDKIAGADDADYLSRVYGLVRDAPNFQLSWDQALDSGQAETLLNNLGQLFRKQITPEQFSANMNKTIK